MKTAMDVLADDLDALARVVFAESRPEAIEKYDVVHGREAAIEGLGLAMHTFFGLYAAKARSEVTLESKADAEALEQCLNDKFGVVDGGSDE